MAYNSNRPMSRHRRPGSRPTALPLKGRQFLDLAMLTEGVVRPPGGTRGDALQQAGTLVNVLGQRSGHNLYLLDGMTMFGERCFNMVIVFHQFASGSQHSKDLVCTGVRR